MSTTNDLFEKVAVIGAGTMGNGIAQVFASCGSSVTLVDVNEEALERGVAAIGKSLARVVKKERMSQEDADAALARIGRSTDLESLGDRELIVEAVSERADLKAKVFRTLDEVAPASAILASNTSSISITEIAAVTGRADRVIGMHFMNPVPLMKLVEVIRGNDTSDATCEQVVGWAQALGKIPVMANDYPGFVANRILMPMINEAICSLHEGVAGVAEIDEVMKLGMAHPMGPLHLADFIGLDVCLSILRVLHDGFGQPKYAPCPLLVNMVTAGKLGVKSGEGFYVHTKGSKDIQVAPAFS